MFRISIFVLAAALRLIAEQGVLVVHVKDIHDQPIKGLLLRAGNSNPSMTDTTGVVRIRLSPQTKEDDSIVLEIVETKNDLAFISPWDKRSQIPLFANEDTNFLSVTLVRRGDRDCLTINQCIHAAVGQVNSAMSPTSASEPAGLNRKGEALTEVAKRFGLKPEELDQAVREWAQRTKDPYDRGMAALYLGHAAEAIEGLKDSLVLHQKDQAIEGGKAANAAFYLGLSLYLEGRYRESAVAYEYAAAFWPNNPLVLDNLGTSWTNAGEYAKAGLAYERAFKLKLRLYGRQDPRVAITLSNEAIRLIVIGEVRAAEPLIVTALQIDQQVPQPNAVYVGTDYDTLGSILLYEGRLEDAEKCYRAAVTFVVNALGPQDPLVARALNNLSQLLQAKGEYAESEAMCRRALAIKEGVLGLEHPSIATSLINLASIRRDRGDLQSPEPLIRRAMAIDERAYGVNHAEYATDVSSLGVLFFAKGDYASAEPLFRQALAIRLQTFGPNHPAVAESRRNLAEVLKAEGRSPERLEALQSTL